MSAAVDAMGTTATAEEEKESQVRCIRLNESLLNLLSWSWSRVDAAEAVVDQAGAVQVKYNNFILILFYNTDNGFAYKHSE